MKYLDKQFFQFQLYCSWAMWYVFVINICIYSIINFLHSLQWIIGQFAKITTSYLSCRGLVGFVSDLFLIHIGVSHLKIPKYKFKNRNLQRLFWPQGRELTHLTYWVFEWEKTGVSANYISIKVKKGKRLGNLTQHRLRLKSSFSRTQPKQLDSQLFTLGYLMYL